MAIYEVYKPSDKPETNGKIVLRDEQKRAIHDAKAIFSKPFTDKKPFHKYLWNAKMRFGKTLCAMQLAKELEAKRTLIVTHRPVVSQSWHEDFDKIFEKDKHWEFGTKFEDSQVGDFGELEKFVKKDDNHYVFFASMQYLRLSSLIKEEGDNDQLKKAILQNGWDLVVVDEAHEGTLTFLGSRVVEMLSKAKTNVLHLSGTPFNLYDDFGTDEIFTWDYLAEQTAKRDWAAKNGLLPNPYAELPTMVFAHYDLGNLMNDDDFVSENAGFMFSEFFRTWTGNTKIDGAKMPEGAKGRFVHEKSVKEFLDLLCKKDESSNYPFSTVEYQKNFKHTLWVVPGVKAAKALERLLKDHNTFKMFKVVNVAGNTDEDVEDDNALNRVLTAIGDAPEKKYTITLSCGRLTTGTTVRPWTAVFYLKGSENTNVATYMQTIFRVQTPYHTRDGRMKAEAYVFDFAPDRSLKMLAETARFMAKTNTDKRKITSSAVANQRELDAMNRLLEFAPVIAQGGQMKKFDANELFAKLNQAKIDRVVQRGFDDTALYNVEELLKYDPKAMNGLLNLLGKTPGTKEATKIDLAKAGLAGKGKKPAPAETEDGDDTDDGDDNEEVKKAKDAARKERDNRIAILRGVSLRIPLLLFGAKVSNEDVGITVDNFTDLVDDASWAEFMPRGFTKDEFNKIKVCYDPVTFWESGKKYRRLAREADRESIETRIKTITTIFSWFHNPDKETVLTPWRVVNMHMSDTIGGYCFFNKKFDGPNLVRTKAGDIVETNEPRFIAHEGVTKDIFGKADENGDTPVRVLEINSKTGLYPLYVTYSLYRSILPTWRQIYGEDGQLSLADEQALWDKILQENIFVVCNTPMAARITERTLRGFREVDGMHIKEEKLVDQAVNNQGKLIKKLNSEKFWFGKGENEMKFNAVVGNPPYQVTTDVSNRQNPIYHHFYDIAGGLSGLYTLITPARFLFNAGLTPAEWNAKMLKDAHLRVVKYIQDATICFHNANINGGVVITLRDAGREFGAIGKFIPNDMLRGIASKFKQDFDTNLSSVVFGGRSDLKFNDKFLKDYPDSPKDRLAFIREKRPSVKKLGPNEEFELKSSTLEALPYAFKDKVSDAKEYYHILGLVNSKRVWKYVRRKYLEPRYSDKNNIERYKVFVSEADGAAGQIGNPVPARILGKSEIGRPGDSATTTFISIGAFHSLVEAKNCSIYLKTRFLRCLLGILKITQHLPPSIWAYVPILDFTSKSDIDWSKSVAEIDQQLYKKYKLTRPEIDFIESMITPME